MGWKKGGSTDGWRAAVVLLAVRVVLVRGSGGGLGRGAPEDLGNLIQSLGLNGEGAEGWFRGELKAQGVMAGGGGVHA